jgi:ketosteroid isomerase-like protein
VGPALSPSTVRPKDNIAIVRLVYEAFERQDLEGLLNLADPDCVVTQDSLLPWGGHYVGRDAVTSFALALVGATDSAVIVESLFETTPCLRMF